MDSALIECLESKSLFDSRCRLEVHQSLLRNTSDLYINRLTFVTGILSGWAEDGRGREEGMRNLCYLLL